MVESFAALCGEAADHGTKIGFELMPFAMIRTLPETLAMIQESGAPNGGIACDMWHFGKLGISNADVSRVPLKYISSVELNDGTYDCPWSLHEDTINHRRFCGEGEFDLKGFISALQQSGYEGPWGIEVLSQEWRTRPLQEVVRHAFGTTAAQFQ